MKRKRDQQLELFAERVGVQPVSPLARATASRSRHIEAPAPKPWLCSVLAVDTARRSGWALGLRGVLVDSGEIDTLDEPTLEIIVRAAVELAEAEAVPIVLVLEAPYGGDVRIVTALGVAKERWLRAWRVNKQALDRVVRIQPSQWRGPVLGREWVGAPRDEVRAHEQRTARALVGRPIGADEAPAILIARWAAHAALVGRAIGARARKASLRAWTGKPK